MGTDITNADFIDITGELDDETNQDVGLESWLHEVGGESVNEIRVFRDVGGGNTKKSYLFTFEPHELNMKDLCDKLRDEFDGGNFRIMAYGAGASKNKMIIKFNRAISIEKARTVTTQPSSNSSDINAVLSTMQAMVEKSEQRMAHLIESISRQQPAQPQFNPMEMQANTIALMVQMKELFGGNNTPQKEDNFEVLMRGFEMAKELGVGGSKEGKNLADVISESLHEFAPLITGALEKANEPKNIPLPNRAPVAPISPIPNGYSQNPTARLQPQFQQEKKSPEMLEKMKLLKTLKEMVSPAKRGSDPGLYADLIFDQFDFDMIQLAVSDPLLIDTIIKYVPEVAPVKPWFEEVIAILKSAGAEEENEEAAENKENESLTIEGGNAINNGNEQIPENIS